MQLSLSNRQTRARTEDGAAWCWGNVIGSRRFLGIPAGEFGSRTPVKIAVGASEITALHFFTCVRRDDRVRCRFDLDDDAAWTELAGFEGHGAFASSSGARA